MKLVTLLAVACFSFAGCTETSTVGGDEGNPFPIPASTVQISGSGATFPKPIIDHWASTYNSIRPTVQVSYAGGGSGKGITDVTEKNVLFAGSDAPMKASERAAAPGILHIPETIGLNALVYNLDKVPDGIKISGNVAGKIFTGAINRWNDPAITALNPGVSMPDAEIAIVYRSDSSGTTFVFTDWLVKVSADWKDKMGAEPSKKPDWTKSTAKQLSGNGNDGVGQNVKNNPNTIGYVELAYVKQLGLKAAKVEAGNGEYLTPTTEGASKAAASAATTLPAADGDWSKVSITNVKSPGAYPISSFSYILVYDSTAAYGGKISAAEMNGFRAWLWWDLHAGQDLAEGLGYAPLPAPVVSIGEDALHKMKV